MLVLQASLEARQYDLASELLRFLIPPGDNDILAAMPSQASASQQDSGKSTPAAGSQSAGVSPPSCHLCQKCVCLRPNMHAYSFQA